MEIVDHINIFRKLLEPIKQLCENLINKYIEYSCEECFHEFKIVLKQTWENIYTEINAHNNEKLNNFLHVTTILTSVVFSEVDHKLSEWKLYENFLKNHYLVKTCLSLSIIENLQQNVFNRKVNMKKEYFEQFFKEKSMEIGNSNTFNTFLLILHQIEVCLEILLNILYKEREMDVLLKESRKYAVQRLYWCLNYSSNPAENLFNEQPSPGSFMQLMDNALDIIYEIDIENKIDKAIETLNISKTYIDELLSHAMSIAQISISEESINIKAGSQKVINECEQLTFECSLENPNIPLCNLLIDSVSDALCSLEQRVNVGVLKLLLEVFKNYDAHLLNLKNYCKTSSNITRSADDLDDLVICFDLQVDRIMHIGLFAVACSTNKQRVLCMRSCLASLESLETELIPAITTYYLEPSIETETHVDILIKHWYEMVNTLQNLIHLIVDPIAFTQVVLNSCNENLENYENPENKCVSNSSELDEFCNKCSLLIRHLNICIPEMYENIPNNIKKQRRLISDLLHECKSAKKVLLDENESTQISEISRQRIIKRFRILIKYLREFYNTLSKFEEDKCVASETTPKLSKTKIDEILQIGVKPDNSKTVGAMALLMLRGEILRKERSILYQTPKKMITPITPYKKVSKVNASKIASTSISFARKLSKLESNTLFENDEINFTDVLKDMTVNLELTKF